MNRRDAIKATAAAAVAAAINPAGAMMGRGKLGAIGQLRPLGLQPAGPPAYYDTELAFLNILKSGGNSATYKGSPWYTSKTSGGVLDTGEEQYLVLDSNGYPTSLTAGNGFSGTQQFDHVTMLLHFNQPALATGQSNYYPPGVYRLRYIGKGTVNIVGDASFTLSNSASNTYVEGTFTVSSSTSSPGMWITITAINSGTDYPRDISVVENQYAASYDAGAIFHPNFLALYSGMKCVRGMQWNKADNIYVGYFASSFSVSSGATSCSLPNSSVWNGPTGTYPLWFYGGQSVQATLTTGSGTATWTGGLASSVSATSVVACAVAWPPQGWSNRTPTTYASYSMAPAGVPEEIILAFANSLTADCWLTPRIDADDTYIANLAILADTTLGPTQKVYIELSNETWNGNYIQTALAQMFGCAQWPAQANAFLQNRNWYGMRSAVMSEIIYNTLGSGKVPSRAIPVIAMQGGNTGTLTQSMDTTYWTGTIDGYTGPASAHKLAAAASNYYWPSSAGRPGGAISSADAITMIGVADPASEFFACMTTNVGTVGNGSHTYSSLNSGGWQGSEKTAKLLDQSTAAGYALPLLTYEGGDNFFADDGIVVGWAALIEECETDSRMETAYQNMLEWYGTNIGATDTNIMILFSDAQPMTSNGCFGLALSAMQTLNATNTPKWQAAQNYLEGH